MADVEPLTRDLRNVPNGTTEIHASGRSLSVPSVSLCGYTVVVTGRWLRMVSFHDEELAPAAAAGRVPQILEQLKHSRGRGDIFTFAQQVLDAHPSHPYYFELDNWAALSTTSFDAWWNQLPQEARKNVRRAAKRGVTVKVATFDDELVTGIQAIYNEMAVRQGRRFWHFGKDVETVRREMDTYLDRSDFIGAYLGGELIGFIKLTYVDRVAVITQILGKTAHQAARPMNALLASAVDLCHVKGMTFLLYGKYVYGRHKQSQLTEFKRRNGFEEVCVPRYFVPLTARGRMALKLRLHTGLRNRLPPRLVDMLLRVRSHFYRLGTRSAPE